jgi:hypothetical protein
MNRANILSLELENHLTESLKNTIDTYEDNKLDEIIKFRIELKRVLNKLIFHKQESVNLSNYELIDILGGAIISTMTLRQNNLDTIGYLLTSGSGIGVIIDKKNDKLLTNNSDNNKLDHHHDFSDIENILNRFDIDGIFIIIFIIIFFNCYYFNL